MDEKTKAKIRIQQALAKKQNKPALSINPEKHSLFEKNKTKVVVQNKMRNNHAHLIKRQPVGFELQQHQKFIPPACHEYNVPNWFRNDKDVDISIIIPCYKSKDYIQKQIEKWHFDEDDGLTKEIIYVSDCCPEKSQAHIINAWSLKEKPKHPVGKIIEIMGFNGGFANACNTGAKFAKGKYLIFLNADTLTTPNWIKPLYDCFQNQKNVGIVGNLHLKEKDIIDSMGSEWDERICAFLHIGKHIHNKKYINRAYTLGNVPSELMQIRQVEMVTGACFMIHSETFKLIEGFDTGYKIGYWEDADLCMKTIAHGLKIFFTPHSIIYHKGGHTNSASHQFVNANRNLFHKKWIKYKMFDKFLARKNIPEIKVNPKSCVVYTAITNSTNNYDTLKRQKKDNDGTEFIAFLETPVPSDFWKFQQIHTKFDDPNRNAKIHKILPHIYFPDKEYSLWIDGSVTIRFPFSVSRLAEIYLADADIALFQHHERDCIYDEADVCIQRKLDNQAVILKQIKKYRSENYPAHNGLGECTVLLRRHTDKIKQFNEMWWYEICNGSRRDQISFNYVVRKLGLKVNYFPGDIKKENYLFSRHMHNGR